VTREGCPVCGRPVGQLHRPTCTNAGRAVAALEPIARGTDPDTSHAAAESAKPTAGTIRRHVLETLRAAGRSDRLRGMTDEELVEHFRTANLPGTPSGIRTRRRELVDSEPPLVADSGVTRRTATGRAAVVWIARP
jgi:hypothetical protein